MKKAGKAIQKKWVAGEPERAKLTAEVKKVAKKAEVRGAELLKSGIKNGMKIGADVAAVIKKDVKEIYKNK